MASAAFTSGAKWSWPSEGFESVSQEDTRRRSQASDEWVTDEDEEIHTPASSHGRVPPDEPRSSEEGSRAQSSKQRHYPPRTCRICLEVVLPTFETVAEGLTGILGPAPRVQYISEDPASGRLIRPCKCKGTQKYVHEGCLQSWRHADPAYGRRNYWECPTCKFRYSLERMRWSNWISSTLSQIVLTVLILLTTVFFLGFVADPIINLYLDPLGSFTSNPFSSRVNPKLHVYDDEDATWTEHILKGLASLGLLGFVKVIFAMSPWQWYNLRNSGLLSGGTRNGRAGIGRDRLADISWWLVIIGVMTFLYVSLES
jgi:hypothetical protein